MSVVVVTGASGFMGRAVADALAASGHDVRRLTRAETGDLSGATDWGPLIAGAACVVHCAARAHALDDRVADPLAIFRSVNRDATLALAHAAARAKVGRLIFVSSIHVNGGETNATRFAATDTPAPQSPYAIAKWEAEQGLKLIAAETGLDVVIIRPPLVIGADPKGNLATLLKLMRAGAPLPFAMVTHNRRDLVSLTTLADLIGVCIAHPAAVGQTLLVSDGVARSTRDICTTLARLNGVHPRFLPVPPALIGLVLSLFGKQAMKSQLLGNLEVDIGATKSRLGWTPPNPL